MSDKVHIEKLWRKVEDLEGRFSRFESELEAQIIFWQNCKEDPHNVANATLASLYSVREALKGKP